MASYQAMLEAWLTEYQPQMKAELLAADALTAYLERQAEAMQAAREQIKAQLMAETPTLSALQADMEAERTMLAQFLPL